jgi:hypothetical protein
MASRPKNNSGALDLVKAFVVLQSFDVTEDDPVSTEDFAAEMGVTPAEAFAALDSLADVELVDAVGRGLSAEWWINVPDVSAENAESIAREALDGMVQVVKDEPRKLTQKEQDYKDRTAYNAYADERAQGFVSSEVIPAVTPVIAENGETVTIPVDFDNPEAGRRELDASKGEQVISEDKVSDIIAEIRKDAPKTADAVQDLADKLAELAPKPLPVIDGLDQFIDDETGDMVYESRIVKSGLALDEPSEIPPTPEGVNANTWHMAHAAITQSARDWWTRQAEQQAEEFKINKGAPAPF